MAGTIVGTLVGLAMFGGVVVVAGFRFPRFGGWLEALLPMILRRPRHDRNYPMPNCVTTR
jgi:hypothetical protein